MRPFNNLIKSRDSFIHNLNSLCFFFLKNSNDSLIPTEKKNNTKNKTKQTSKKTTAINMCLVVLWIINCSFIWIFPAWKLIYSCLNIITLQKDLLLHLNSFSARSIMKEIFSPVIIIVWKNYLNIDLVDVPTLRWAKSESNNLVNPGKYGLFFFIGVYCLKLTFKTVVYDTVVIYAITKRKKGKK